jgi:hypothetical protein
MNRRSLFKAIAAGSLTAAHPLACLLTRSAMAQTGTAPIRTLYSFFPQGVTPDLFFPKAGSRELPVQTQPLQDLYDNLVFIDGLCYTEPFADRPVNDGNKQCLSGTITNSTSIDVLMGREDWANRQTTGITMPTVQVNVGVDRFYSGISLDNGVAMPINPDPRRLYAKLFGAAEGSAAAIDPVNASILSLARQDLAAIRANIGNVDGQRDRLDIHTDALSLLEQKLAGSINTDGSLGCKLPPISLAPDIAGTESEITAAWSTTDILPLASDLQQDIVIAAFSCGITKSIVMPYGLSNGYVVCPDCIVSILALDSTDKANTSAVRWWTKELAKLIKKLANTPDQNGSLLDNTIVLTVSNAAEGSHSRYRLPTILASGVKNNVGLVTGRSLDFRDAPNRIHVANVGAYIEIDGKFTQEVDAISHTDVLETIRVQAGYNSFTLPQTFGGIPGAWTGGNYPI